MALTSKQDKFCRCVANGMSYKDAYLEAYDCKTDTTAYNESSKLALREDIQERIKALIKPLEQAAITNVLTEREKKKAIIWEEIEHARTQQDHAAIARYMDILNKMDSEYININRNIEDKPATITNLSTTDLENLLKIG